MKQDRYTRSARGQHCTVRLPGVCDDNTETTVLAHLNGGGMGMKKSSIHGAYSCAKCHDALDRRTWTDFDRDFLNHAHLEGVIRTQAIMIRDGVLKL